MAPSGSNRWYHDFFGRAPVAEVTEGRAEQEVEYLLSVLAELPPGARVLDLASGGGSRAVGLARAGFEVVALDLSRRALESARELADEARVAVDWRRVDPLTDAGWPTKPVDAVVCMTAVGWGSDADQRRLLRRLRRLLAPGGLLVVERTPSWLAATEWEYDPVAGRARGSLGGVPFDVRLYPTTELCALVRTAGFAVERVDAGLVPGRALADESDGAAIVARAVPTPPRALAVASWRTQAGPRLDLRYAPDEAELLEPLPAKIWSSLVLGTRDGGASVVGGYGVDDPYGGERGAVVVGGYFGIPVRPRQVTFGSGVTSFLHGLAALADGGPVLASELVHGDLEAWAGAQGSEARLVPEAGGLAAFLDELDREPAALVHLDRPTFTGRLLALDELEELTQAAACVGAPVVVDESAAPYLGPSGSGATIVPRTENLVVLRGFTKAYSLGGLRAAFAVASAGIAARVREVVPPLQVGELALHAALRLLAAGDVFGRLRERVRAVKPRVVALLEDAGLEVFAGEPFFPWVAVADPGGAATRLLDRCGVRALAPAPPPGATAEGIQVLRLTIPLAQARLELLEELLRDGAADAAGRTREPKADGAGPSDLLRFAT
ncbi:MAG TPA: aminotransferase class I/II-fold pyridoxal phosphate-dependent enzyme [Gaiellaceae bacterium]